MLNYESNDNLTVSKLLLAMGMLLEESDYSLIPLMFHRNKENSLLLNVRIQDINMHTSRYNPSRRKSNETSKLTFK